MGNLFSQIFVISAAPFTEEKCPDQTGRVFLITGGYAGVGFELCKILYAHNATVWIAGRDESKAQKAIDSIKSSSAQSKGSLHFLFLDLSNFSTIKPAVESFTAQEQRLDVLVNNAGVMFPPPNSTDAHGNELQFGINCLGPCLLTQLLLPQLIKTASSSPTASVRVLWAASIAVHVGAPSQGIILDSEGRPTAKASAPAYAESKVGNVFLARHFAVTTARAGVVHAAFNPGNLRSELQRHMKGLGYWLLDKMLYTPIHGAYTELWAALTPELTPDKSGAYVYPWGRFGPLPQGVEDAMKGTQEGGTGVAEKFVRWCEERTKEFA